MPLPPDPFGRARLPGTFDRAGRVALLDEVGQALLEGRAPSREAALFVGGAIAAYLESGGDLARDFLKISPPRGSHKTPARLASSR